jgi:dienelactone hydrolase
MLMAQKSANLVSRLVLIGCLVGLSAGCGEDAAKVEEGSPSESEPDEDSPSGGNRPGVDGGTVKPTSRPDAATVKPGTGTVKPGTDGGTVKPGSGTTDGATVPPIKPPVKGDGGTTATPAPACASNLLEGSDDPGAQGPWDTGVRTVKIARLTVEVFYPAQPGSTAGVPEVTYDARQWLPELERKKVTDEHTNIVQPIGGHLYRDVPLDTDHGPYPLVVFIHGTASHRAASVSTNKHWASHGFIVLAADYPGLGLGDQMASTLECLQPTTGAQDLPGDVNLQLKAMASPSGDLAFLADRVDTTRVAISGHSQGGCITATLSALPNVKLVMPFSGSTTISPSTSLESVLYVSGMADTVIGYAAPALGNTVCPLGSSDTVDAFVASPGPPKVKKRLVGITGGGHLSVTDLCDKNKLGKSSIEELQAARVCGVASAVIIGLPALFDCGTIDYKQGIAAVNYATTAALEETLHCKDLSKQFANLKSALPQVGEFRETLK